MNLSAILVLLRRDSFDDGLVRLAAQPGVEVHHADIPSGRVIVTQEAPSVHDEVEGLKALKALPGVIFAELVYHVFEDDPQMRRRDPARPPADLDAFEGLGHVPHYLNAP